MGSWCAHHLLRISLRSRPTTHLLEHGYSLPTLSSVFKTDIGLDKPHCTLLHVLDLELALWLTPIQALACGILRRIRTQLYTFRCSRARLTRLGGSDGTDAVDVDGLDGRGEPFGRHCLCRKGEHDLIQSLLPSTNAW